MVVSDLFFFCKQKTAYEMRISDWSSDVCSSDLGLPSVIAVTDRVGNVLGVFRMNGARATATTSPAPNGDNIDAQNVTFPAEGGAIAKAVTGAYLSSGGNAFSTRTASQIVQEHFRSEEHTSELQSLMRISYAVLCLKKK